jgi:NADPH-dependent 2,4-dienoyl-CoA reductase/sulfur reductase-like enzyme
VFPKERASGQVWTIRHVDDAIGLRGSLSPGVRLAVIGGGFIGAEVASSARRLGTDVTIYEAAQIPFKAVLGAEVAEKIGDLHRRSGVHLECGATVLSIGRNPAGGQDLQLSNGRSARADVVVAGLGAIPNVEWLAGSGLLLRDGVVCNEFGETSAAGIFAAGDAASWRDPFTGQHIRAEHWTSAREQARIVAQEIVAARHLLWEDHVPYFWSDLHGSRIQVLGNPQWADDVRFVGAEGADNSFVAEYTRRGHLLGVAGCNAAAKTMRYRTQLATARSKTGLGSPA